MGTSNKCALKTITALYIAFFFLHLPAGSANSIPTAEDINALAKRAKLTADTFMQESFEPRMRYEYSGEFLHQDDKENLHELAKRASKQLQAIAKAQKELKNEIEDYEGDDWDDRYGASGLWRKLSRDLYATTLSKCEVDFYLALSSNHLQANKTSQDTLAQIDSLNQSYNAAYLQFLKAKTLTLLARTDPTYKPLAKKEFDWLSGRSDMSHPTVFRIAIERIKLLGETEPNELDKLAEAIAKSDCSDDIELVLSLALLQRRLNKPKAFEKTVHFWPQTENFLGSLVLSDLSQRVEQQQSLEQVTVFEAELAAQAAWKNRPKDYETVLNHLASAEKFQTPLILYVTAVTFADSSPIKTVNLLEKASRLQQLQKSKKLDIEPYKIAGQAAQLAYNLFIKDPGHCRLAVEAFDNYSAIANEKMDAELQYIYSIILQRDGQTEKSKKTLHKLAQKSSDYWSSRAKLDLIEQAIEQKQEESQSIPNELFIKLKNLISECSEQDKESNQLRAEAITIYCQLLLEKQDQLSAQEVLNTLSKEKLPWSVTLTQIKSKALRLMGRFNEAAQCLALSSIINDVWVREAMQLLSEAIGLIDRLQTENMSPDSDRVIGTYYALAKHCYSWLNSRKSALFLAEIAVLAAEKQKDKLLEAEKVMEGLAQKDSQDVDLLRCRARLLTEQGKLEKATKLWTQVANIRKSDTPSAHQRSWKWWRAKFYELDCWYKCPQTQNASVLHTIEVLENSFHDIPPLWAEKLSSLKQQCQSQLTGAGN